MSLVPIAEGRGGSKHSGVCVVCVSPIRSCGCTRRFLARCGSSGGGAGLEPPPRRCPRVGGACPARPACRHRPAGAAAGSAPPCVLLFQIRAGLDIPGKEGGLPARRCHRRGAAGSARGLRQHRRCDGRLAGARRRGRNTPVRKLPCPSQSPCEGVVFRGRGSGGGVLWFFSFLSVFVDGNGRACPVCGTIKM